MWIIHKVCIRTSHVWNSALTHGNLWAKRYVKFLFHDCKINTNKKTDTHCFSSIWGSNITNVTIEKKTRHRVRLHGFPIIPFGCLGASSLPYWLPKKRKIKLCSSTVVTQYCGRWAPRIYRENILTCPSDTTT